MATMKDIADRMHVSINAVSLALNNKPGVSEELRLQVLRLADEMGYIDKKEKFLNTYRKTNLCVMMQEMYHTDIYFYSKVLCAVTGEAAIAGYDSVVHFFDDKAINVPNALSERRVAGIIVIGKLSDANLNTLLAYDIPIVLVDHASLSFPTNCVVTDNKSGGFLATKYLLEKGFKNIGFFGDLDYSLSIKERYFGFEQAIRALAPDLAEEAVAYSITTGVERNVLNNDSVAITEIIEKRPSLPQAFICSNDFAAIVLQTSLRRMGLKVPQDISLIGFDDIDLCSITTPHLTSIKVNMSGMGKRAIGRLMQMIHQRDKTVETIVMGVSLVERDTVVLPEKNQRIIGYADAH